MGSSTSSSTRQFDVVVLGAGAAGLMAAIEAGKRGRRVLVVDHAAAPGEKIRISGGGRCNFTNVNTRPDRFISANPRFCVSALARYTPARFIALVKSHNIEFHEKTQGQLFCNGSALEIVNMLTAELRRVGGVLELATTIEGVTKTESGFAVALSSDTVGAGSLIVATGGKSIPKMGATNFAYRLAEQFGLKVTETRPALVPLTFEPRILQTLAPLAGISADAVATANGRSFREALLFTHRGLSGPAILQVSSYWREGDAISIDLLPDTDVAEMLRTARQQTPRQALQTVLAEKMSKRLAQRMADEIGMAGMVGDFSDKKIAAIAEGLKRWTLKPTGSEGYRTAEVTLGGIDTAGLESQTMAARGVKGLYFVGEAVDVTGWLGGYNFQWAWASGWAAGQVA
jgi:predicted Rossmann fold flavoprotein